MARSAGPSLCGRPVRSQDGCLGQTCEQHTPRLGKRSEIDVELGFSQTTAVVERARWVAHSLKLGLRGNVPSNVVLYRRVVIMVENVHQALGNKRRISSPRIKVFVLPSAYTQDATSSPRRTDSPGHACSVRRRQCQDLPQLRHIRSIRCCIGASAEQSDSPLQQRLLGIASALASLA